MKASSYETGPGKAGREWEEMGTGTQGGARPAGRAWRGEERRSNKWASFRSPGERVGEGQALGLGRGGEGLPGLLRIGPHRKEAPQHTCWKGHTHRLCQP